MYYISEIEITNIRSIKHFHWELPDGHDPGWHVILGGNGVGKTSLLRAVALTFLEKDDIMALRQPWEKWLRQGFDSGKIGIQLHTLAAEKGRAKRKGQVSFHREKNGDVRISTPISLWHSVFTASYGPFRRFSGGDKNDQILFKSHPELGRHLSLFGENIALTETLSWLRDLRFKELENNAEASHSLRCLRTFINQEGFLPNNTKLSEITSDQVFFEDGNGARVDIDDLSDGFRSILSLCFELIRQLLTVFKCDLLFCKMDPNKIIAPGVVLIDEIDAHLHPTWQRRIGLWFRKHFPNIQFIVTTHSPLVCQASDQGSVWRLPAVGSDDPGGFVTGTDLQRLLYGTILEAYATGAFGTTATRSEKGQVLLEELAENRIKELEDELRENDGRLQQAFKQLDRLLKEKDQLAAEKERNRELYEKKMSQMRKQFQERLNQRK